MAAPFTFTGYVLGILDEKRICVRVDEECLELISSRLTSYNNKTTVEDTVVVNVSDANFVIHIKWNSLTDFIGVHVKINAALRRYSFWKTKDMHDESNVNNTRTVSVQRKGVSIIAKQISMADC
jgi:hypothetical protein